MENKNRAHQGLKVYGDKNLVERECYHHYDDFFDRFKTWEQIRTERYNSC